MHTAEQPGRKLAPAKLGRNGETRWKEARECQQRPLRDQRLWAADPNPIQAGGRGESPRLKKENDKPEDAFYQRPASLCAGSRSSDSSITEEMKQPLSPQETLKEPRPGILGGGSSLNYITLLRPLQGMVLVILSHIFDCLPASL